ncbi:MAG TPA: hypothetical protein P5133_14255, partial [Spirochaetia bacterium]|nr:hypothetical protein [Spirochaetia bacterium]
PPREGCFELSFEPLPVLEPGGAFSSLRVPTFIAELDPATAPFPGQAEAGQPGRFDAAMESSAAFLAAELPGLPALLAAALRGQSPAARRAGLEALLGLLEGQPPKLRRDPRLLLLEAGLRWELGERGRGLSLLYGLLRRKPGSTALKELAAACSGELGSGPPLLDSLPSPTSFEAVGAVALLGAFALFLSSRRSRRPLRAAAAACLLGLSLAAAGLSLAAAGQRRRSFVLLWSDSLLPVPSPLAEGALPLAKGSTAELRGRSSGYVGVTLAQGLSGWVREADVYYY